jgi:hypothetical protein
MRLYFKSSMISMDNLQRIMDNVQWTMWTTLSSVKLSIVRCPLSVDFYPKQSYNENLNCRGRAYDPQNAVPLFG